jgi:hypothetical protein
MLRQRLVVGLVVAAAVAAWCWRAAAPGQEPDAPAKEPGKPEAPAKEPEKPEAPAKEPALQGVIGCTAAGCHHGNAEGNVKGSEYTVWVNRDPHARAYQVLYDKRSRQLVADLYGPEAKPAWETRLCLKCHAADPDAPHAETFSAADGVGCESCHGPAEKWKSEHPCWPKDKPLAEKLALGMRDTKDLVARAQLCVTCHVGTAGQDVNHDLIAAGHPRLNFEFSSYLEAYPRHWGTEGEPEASPDFHARAWAIGQLVSARAALQLLQERAAAAARPPNAEHPERNSPWPEFAEYNCAACHQALAPELRRTEASNRGRRLGALPWGSWYLSMVQAYAAGSPGEDVRALPSGPLTALRELMEQPNPDPARVARAAAPVTKTLGGWLDRVKGGPLAPADAKKLLAGFLDEGEAQADGMTFDEAAQLYVAVAALRSSLADARAGPAEAGGLDRALQALAGQLTAAFPKGSDSPLLFNPRGEPSLRERFQAIKRSLGD